MNIILLKIDNLRVSEFFYNIKYKKESMNNKSPLGIQQFNYHIQ